MRVRTRAQGAANFPTFLRGAFVVALFVIGNAITSAQTTDQVPPSTPTALTAAASSCGEVDLSWAASTDNAGGSGLKAYVIERGDGVRTTIASARTTFSDTNFVKSSTSLTYTVSAIDNAGNSSSPSSTASVTTPACPTSLGEQVVDSAFIEPLGKTIATYGSRTALIYQKWNSDFTSKDTWVYVSDSDTGQTSRLLLHTPPAYYQRETDYVLTSANELWTLSCDYSASGRLLVSQYRLNGTPPTSATLLSTQALGDSSSYGMSMIQLQSGALMVAWNEYSLNYSGNFVTGYAYRSPSGNWSVQFPVTLGGPGITKSHMTMMQHPADGSVWAFIKVDSSVGIIALHFTEASNSVALDWTNPAFISQNADGDNGPEGEFPFLTAASDPTRNAILLAYQSQPYEFVYVDPLYGSSNSIFLKQAYATVAQIAADGSKTFIPFQTYMERLMQFGMSVLPDGTIWMTYQPINAHTNTWNETYASSYTNGSWSAPTLVGYNYNNYNTASGLGYDPGAMIHRNDRAEVAFLTPDQKVHTFNLLSLAPAPADSTAPTTSITSPVNGANATGTLAVSALASDNIGVTNVEFLVDGAVKGTATSAPYSFSWDSASVANGSHTLQTRAYDAAGNVGQSASVSIIVGNLTASSLSVAVTSPKNGSVVPRNQKVTVSATATDSVAVTKVEFYIDNSLLGTRAAAPYSYPWKVPGKPGARHSVQAKAYDATGKSASQTVTVTAQ